MTVKSTLKNHNKNAIPNLTPGSSFIKLLTETSTPTANPPPIYPNSSNHTKANKELPCDGRRFMKMKAAKSAIITKGTHIHAAFAIHIPSIASLPTNALTWVIHGMTN